jgi:hypothetical protein
MTNYIMINSGSYHLGRLLFLTVTLFRADPGKPGKPGRYPLCLTTLDLSANYNWNHSIEKQLIEGEKHNLGQRRNTEISFGC